METELRSTAAARRVVRPPHPTPPATSLRRVWLLPLAGVLFVVTFFWYLITGDSAAIAPCIVSAALVAAAGW